MNANVIIRFVWTCLLLIALQVLVFQNLSLGGFVFSFPYIGILIMWPVQQNRALSMLLAFAIGLFMDMYFDSYGIHAFSCTAVMFMREPLLRSMFSETDRNNLQLISTREVDLNTFIVYALIMLLVHHSLIFFLEAWSWGLWWRSLFKIILSSLFSFLVISLVQTLTLSKVSRR